MQNIDDAVSNEVQEAATANQLQPKEVSPQALKVCILTADFWGLKSAGGTATAYHLLAAVLAKSPQLHVGLPSPFLACAHPQACPCSEYHTEVAGPESSLLSRSQD